MTREQFINCTVSAQGALRRFLTGLCCGDSQLADDIAQEALLKAYLSAAELRNPEKFPAWIRSIAYNTFLNHRRAEKPTCGYDSAREVPAPGDDAFRYQALYQALERLPARERTSILLFYMEDYSVKEIAAIIGAKEDAVRQYLFRGRKHLEILIEK